MSLAKSSSLHQLLPYYKSHLKNEIEGKHVSLLFDGTTRVCEALVVVLRFLDNDWHVQQRVCRLMLLEKSMN